MTESDVVKGTQDRVGPDVPDDRVARGPAAPRAAEQLCCRRPKLASLDGTQFDILAGGPPIVGYNQASACTSDPEDTRALLTEKVRPKQRGTADAKLESVGDHKWQQGVKQRQ